MPGLAGSVVTNKEIHPIVRVLVINQGVKFLDIASLCPIVV